MAPGPRPTCSRNDGSSTTTWYVPVPLTPEAPSGFVLPVLNWLKLYVPLRPVLVVARTLPLESSNCTVSPDRPMLPPPPRGPLLRVFMVTVPLIDDLN